MQCNVGGSDRIVRFVLGAIIMVMGLMYGSWWGVLGLIIFLTAVFSRCPAYLPFGVSTCSTKNTPPNSSQPLG